MVFKWNGLRNASSGSGLTEKSGTSHHPNCPKPCGIALGTHVGSHCVLAALGFPARWWRTGRPPPLETEAEPTQPEQLWINSWVVWKFWAHNFNRYPINDPCWSYHPRYPATPCFLPIISDTYWSWLESHEWDEPLVMRTQYWWQRRTGSCCNQAMCSTKKLHNEPVSTTINHYSQVPSSYGPHDLNQRLWWNCLW